MKRILIGTAAAVLALAASCQRETAPESAGRAGIVLDVRCAAPATKAELAGEGTLAGEDDYNENLINTLDYFLYAAGAEGAAPVLKGRTAPGTRNQATLSVEVNEDEVNRLFPGLSTTCTAFLVANYPGTLPENPTLAELKALEVSADFASGTQESFVMTAEATVNLISRKKTLAAEETVELKRLASKVSIQFKVAESATLEHTVDGQTTTTTWKPVLDDMRVYLVNGVGNTTLSGDPAASPDTFDYGERKATDTVTRDGDTYYTPAPFYSYPQTWEYGTPAEPYLKLVIPWKKQGDDGQTVTEVKQYYYRVFCPGNAFERNRWYRILLDVSILGSETDDVDVDIQGSYYVADWGESVDNAVKIVASRYLSVPQIRYDLYHVEDLTIEFISSHACELTKMTATYEDVSGNTATTVNLTDTYTLFLFGRTVNFHHTINNDFTSPDFIASPMKFTFTVHQKDDTEGSFDKEVTIYQYPSMSLEASRNSTYNASTFPSGNGNVYVNGKQTIEDQPSGWDEIVSIKTGTNQNPNMYIIGVGNLSEDMDYRIGDPRQDDIDNLGYNLSMASMENGTRNLTWYYPTEDSDRTLKMMAPKIRVASSYGMSGQQISTLENAKKRCASYQEDGYPAGRWRLPTFAEIEFISTLSVKGLIPKLFSMSKTGAYWSAHGRVYAKDNTTPSLTPNSDISDLTKQMVRCVYDEWYWSDTCNKTTKTWGDAER